jgi:hypothetical protein
VARPPVLIIILSNTVHFFAPCRPVSALLLARAPGAGSCRAAGCRGAGSCRAAGWRGAGSGRGAGRAAG